MYGEPDPGKIPTGSMTTFTASRRRFGKEKSRSSNMCNKVCALLSDMSQRASRLRCKAETQRRAEEGDGRKYGAPIA